MALPCLSVYEASTCLELSQQIIRAWEWCQYLMAPATCRASVENEYLRAVALVQILQRTRGGSSSALLAQIATSGVDQAMADSRKVGVFARMVRWMQHYNLADEVSSVAHRLRQQPSQVSHLIPAEAQAFALETIACRSFADAENDAVQRYVSAHIAGASAHGD